MRKVQRYSRRQFLHAGAAGVAAGVVPGGLPLQGRAAQVQAPPPASTAPRVLRKPPIAELDRIAKMYDMQLSAEDLASFRNLMDGVLASYRSWTSSPSRRCR